MNPVLGVTGAEYLHAPGAGELPPHAAWAGNRSTAARPGHAGPARAGAPLRRQGSPQLSSSLFSEPQTLSSRTGMHVHSDSGHHSPVSSSRLSTAGAPTAAHSVRHMYGPTFSLALHYILIHYMINHCVTCMHDMSIFLRWISWWGVHVQVRRRARCRPLRRPPACLRGCHQAQSSQSWPAWQARRLSRRWACRAI